LELLLEELLPEVLLFDEELPVTLLEEELFEDEMPELLEPEE
jgi:hypothetical protein